MDSIRDGAVCLLRTDDSLTNPRVLILRLSEDGAYVRLLDDYEYGTAGDEFSTPRESIHSLTASF